MLLFLNNAFSQKERGTSNGNDVGVYTAVPPKDVPEVRLVLFNLFLLAFITHRDDEKSEAIFKGLGECVPFEGEGDDGGGGSDEDEGPPAKKRRGRPAAGGSKSKKAAKGSAKKAAAGAKKGKGKAKR